MPINLGDAAFQFIADTTQLDQAVARTPAEVDAKMAPVRETLDGVAQGWTKAGAAATKGAEQAAAAAATTGKSAEAAAQQTERASNVITGSWFRVAQATQANAVAQKELQETLRASREATVQDEATTNQLALAQERAALAAHELSEAQREANLTLQEETVSMSEAKGTIALLGEETGVKMPRHLRSFVAGLPGVGAALEAAFSAVAVLILIQILVEATKKLSEFVAEHFIYTEALKEADAAQLSLNKAIVENDDKLKALKKTIEDFNLTPLEKANKVLHENTTELEAQRKQLAEATEEARGYAEQLQLAAREREAAAAAGDNSIGGIDVEAVQKNAAEVGLVIARLQSDIKRRREQDLANQLEYDKLAKEDFIAAQEAMHKAAADVAKSNLDLWRAASRAQLAERKADYVAQGALEAEFAEKEFALERSTLVQRLAILREDPTKNKNAIVELNGQIEAADREHHAKLLNQYAEFRDKLRSMLTEKIALEASTIRDAQFIPSAEVTALQQLEEAFKQLGITGSATFQQQKVAAEKAYNAIRVSGMASQVDLLRGERALLTATIAYNAELGKPATDNQRKRLVELTTQIKLLTGEADKVPRKFDSISGALDRFVQRAREARGAMNETRQIFDAAASDMSQSFGNAVAEFEQGQVSMGTAIEKALAQYLTSLSAKAAMDALYFTAWGIADAFWNPARSGADFAAAAEFAGLSIATGVAAYALNKASGGQQSQTATGNAAPGAPTSSPATQGEASPVQQTNVQHFARGGLIQSPTLAVLGDAVMAGNGSGSPGKATEGVIPLDDPKATGAIADAITARMHGRGSAGGVAVYVKGMISPDNLGKVVKNINRKVRGNQLHLESSATLRVNKRSV